MRPIQFSGGGMATGPIEKVRQQAKNMGAFPDCLSVLQADPAKQGYAKGIWLYGKDKEAFEQLQTPVTLEYMNQYFVDNIGSTGPEWDHSEMHRPDWKNVSALINKIGEGFMFFVG